MPVVDKRIPLIEKALGFKLYEQQKQYIFNGQS